MTQDKQLYESTEIWNQPIQTSQKNLARAIADFWPKEVRSALDVGCGDGKLTESVRDLTGSEFFGLDASHVAISRLSLNGLVGDAGKLPFSDSSFELCLCADTLEHLPDSVESAAWRELFRVAKKWVIVAVPFREFLLDATTRCSECGMHYHVNWHQRSYDITDLHASVSPGWKIAATIVTGDSWVTTLPPETYVRRMMFDEWSGWEMAVCPRCGDKGTQTTEPRQFSESFSVMLAENIYQHLKSTRYWRSHSEIVVIYEKDVADLTIDVAIADRHSQLAGAVDFRLQSPAPHLVAFPQVAQYLATGEDNVQVQFPIYSKNTTLEVEREPGSTKELYLRLEDAKGMLFDGKVLEKGQGKGVCKLPREPVPGYYGVLGNYSNAQMVKAISLGGGPEVTWLKARDAGQVSYFKVLADNLPIYIQITSNTWIEPNFIDQNIRFDEFTFSVIVFELQKLQEKHLESLHVANAVIKGTLTNILNEIAESDAIRRTYRDWLENSSCNPEQEADSFNQQIGSRVDHLKRQDEYIRSLGNHLLALGFKYSDSKEITAEYMKFANEYKSLQELAVKFEKDAVKLQNISAEREALLERLKESERRIVAYQNIEQEKEIYRQQANEKDACLIELENLKEERTGLLQLLKSSEDKIVSLQNVKAENEIYQKNIVQFDSCLVELQNLRAEKESLLGRLRECDAQIVKCQNIEAENIVYRDKAIQLERCLVDSENLKAERDALLGRLKECDKEIVRCQNIDAENTILRDRLKELDQCLVELQNLRAERLGLLSRIERDNELLVNYQAMQVKYSDLRIKIQELIKQDNEYANVKSLCDYLNSLLANEEGQD